jgi:hypothetical protein
MLHWCRDVIELIRVGDPGGRGVEADYDMGADFGAASPRVTPDGDRDVWRRGDRSVSSTPAVVRAPVTSAA